jgi:murein DD-endopeptidase MepM/ murein hydrolase activator NlpD
MPGFTTPLLVVIALVVGGSAVAAARPSPSARPVDARLPNGPAAAVRDPTPAAAVPFHGMAPQGWRPFGDPSVVQPSASVGQRSIGQRSVGPPRPGNGWRWPLTPEPGVARGFRLGPHPWSPGHRGVDLSPAGGAGATVSAAGPGVVRFAGVVSGRGVVTVDHGSGLRTTYEPVTPSVRAGKVVAVGDPLGTLVSGRSHCGAVACLHWGALLGDRYLDPLTLLRPRDPPILLPMTP